MKEGDIVLTPLPQSDGRIKSRPALFLCKLPPFADCLLCGISTQVHQAVPKFDEIVSSGDSDFKDSGLVEASVIRLGFLGVVPQKKIIGSISKIDRSRHRRLLTNLSEHLSAISREIDKH